MGTQIGNALSWHIANVYLHASIFYDGSSLYTKITKATHSYLRYKKYNIWCRANVYCNMHQASIVVAIHMWDIIKIHKGYDKKGINTLFWHKDKIYIMCMVPL